MTAPDPRLDEIQARLGLHYEEVAYMSGSTRHYCAEDGETWPCADVTDYAQEDIRYLLAELRKAHEALERVEKVRKELFEFSKDSSLAIGQCAAYRDSSRAINTALRAAVAAAKGDERG